MKKYHKLHRHNDVTHRRSSKSKNRHKQHKKEHPLPVSESVLEPIQEVSKEKVKIDKNACGDCVNSLARSQLDDERKKKTKHRREKSEKCDKVDKLDPEETDIFSKNYLRKLTKSTDEKLVRHHSLEKNEDGLINKTKNLFRKEKSFNDAVQKVSLDLEITEQHKKEKKQRRASRKKEIKERRNNNHEASVKKGDTQAKGDDKEEKRKKSPKKKAKSNENSRLGGKNMYSRVQEVIYCQLDQVPYHLKNDKSGAEIKDLYQRIKREKKLDKEGERTSMDISHSHREGKKKHDLERDKSYQSHHSPLGGIRNIAEENINERSKSRPKRGHEEHRQKEEALPETRSREHNDKDRHHSRQRHYDQEHSSKKTGRKKDSLSNIDLGPYHKYFAFENKDTRESCYEKRHKKDEKSKKDTSSSRDKKHIENREHVIYNLKYDHTLCKKKSDRHEDKTEPTEENKLNTDVDKIHQIVEGDLKTYFLKIQHMIDQKLDALLQINKSNDEKVIIKTTKEKENRKRSRSKPKDKKSDKEEKSSRKKDDKNKKINKSPEVKDENTTKEEIIQEVLKRIKKEVKKEHNDKEKKSKVKADKEVCTKHENSEMYEKITKNDSKAFIDMSQCSSKRCQDKSLDQKTGKSDSRSQDITSIQKSSRKKHRESVKNLEPMNLELKDTHPSHRSSDKQSLYEGASRSQDMYIYRQREPLNYQHNRQSYHADKHSSRHSRSPDNTCNLNDPKHTCSSRRSLDKQQRSPEKRAKDSLVSNRSRCSPPPELIIPADISVLDWEAHLRSKRRHRKLLAVAHTRREEELSHHLLKKHYTSASSCRACSEHYLVPTAELGAQEQRSEQVVTHQFDQRHVASEEMNRKSRHLGNRRRSSSPERCIKINPARDDQNNIFYGRCDRMPPASHEAHSPREHVMASRPEDYIMAPREFRKPKERLEECAVHNRYQEPVNRSPDGRRSRRDVVVQYTDLNQENLILPPDMFRTLGRNDLNEHQHNQGRFKSPERQHPRQEFIVQGIEPPILESSRNKQRGWIRTRNLECKTVSIVGIPPQIAVKDVTMVHQTQTTSNSQKSATPDRDLVEKRKQSKRFKLYYRYSVVNNNKEDRDSGTSDAKSIASDSFRVVSDPSDEEKAMIYYSRDVKTTRERYSPSELSQILSIIPKKWNKIATPRDSHLNNIIEEPSNISNATRNDVEYFIPIRGTNECYFRALTSSHSEYCFKINKKPANSNISILSKDTCDGRYRFNHDGRCRYCKHEIRSKSDCNMVSHGHGIQIFKSKSDVYLGGASGRKVIRSIFLEDTHPYVKSKRSKDSSKQNPVFKSIFKAKNIVKCCKDCQTSDLKVNYDFVPDEEESNLVFEDKQRQFEDIYKTIDHLEENIHSSRKAPPNMLDVAISSKFVSLDKISDKQSQLKKIYKSIDNLQDKMLHASNKEKESVKTVNVATGSPLCTRRSQRSRRIEQGMNTHEIAVGHSKAQMVKVKTPCRRSQSRGKMLKSTGVSPIRVVEDLQNSSKSPSRKTNTPMSPNKRFYAVGPATQKPARSIRDDNSTKKIVQKEVEIRREPTNRSSLRPKIIIVKDTKPKSPEKTQSDNEDQNTLKQGDVWQPGQAIRVLRSEEKSVSLKKRKNSVENRSRDRKPVVTTTTKSNSPQNQLRQKKEAASKEPCFIENVSKDAKPVITIPTTQGSSKASARKPKEKENVLKKPPSRNYVDDVHKSCVHHYHRRDLNSQKSPKITDVEEKTAAGTTVKPVIINTAVVKSRPSSQKKCIPSGGSTSSSVSGGPAQNVRRSRSLVELRSQRKCINRSNSEIINVEKAFVLCKSSGLETTGESLLSGNMEKFANMPRLRCHSSKSNVHSLDQFIGNKFTSRLFLTKDYKGGEISSYQRRKLYDQSIRQKMKKKFRFSKLDVGPQIFEVRFLSMVNQEDAQTKEKQTRFKHYLERPLFTLNLEKVKTDGSFCQKETRSPITAKNEDEVSRAQNEDDFNKVNNPTEKDVIVNNNKKSDQCIVVENNFQLTNKVQSVVDKQKDENNSNRKEGVVIDNISTKAKDNSITELYFKDPKTNQERLLRFCNKLLEVNSSLQLPEEFKGAQCTCSKYSENCQSCKHFVNLMDMLCSSVVSYCDSKTELIDFQVEHDFEFKSLENDNEYVHNSKNNTKVDKLDTDKSDNLHAHLPNLEKQKICNNMQEIFPRSGNSLGESNESTDPSDNIFKNLVECVSLSTTNRTDDALPLPQPLSCPVLPTNTSSFEYLYEETSSSDNEGIAHEIVLANLTRPLNQTFNFSLSQYNVETPYFRRNSYYSATGSLESGYASIKSKSCVGNSVTNFFKKPNIAALFKPPGLTGKKSELKKFGTQRSPSDFKKKTLYEEMTKSCQLYAKKVRESSEMKLAENVDEYQEFSLACLLGKNSAVVLESMALRQHSITHIPLLYNEDGQFNTEETIQSISKQESGSFLDTAAFAKNGCRLVLGNECLKLDSITYLGAEIFNEKCLDQRFKIAEGSQQNFVENIGRNDHDKVNFKDEYSCSTLDFSLDSNNPFGPSKDVLTQKFFGSLLKVYEKEIEFCKELFENDEFLQNVLLPAVEERKTNEKRHKKGRFSRFFRKKLQQNQNDVEENKCERGSNLQAEASTKLQSLAFNAKKCFTMLAEAVKINERIDDEIKICGLLKLLERIESGDFYMIKNNGDSTIEQDIKSQVKEAFINIYEICEKEAKRAKRSIGDQEIGLIKAFVSIYRIGLLSKTDIVACYIGRGVIQTESQLKAAVTYLMRSQSNEVNINEFEEYCNFTKSFEK